MLEKIISVLIKAQGVLANLILLGAGINYIHSNLLLAIIFFILVIVMTTASFKYFKSYQPFWLSIYNKENDFFKVLIIFFELFIVCSIFYFNGLTLFSMAIGCVLSLEAIIRILFLMNKCL